jgi:hypothetical protein
MNDSSAAPPPLPVEDRSFFSEGFVAAIGLTIVVLAIFGAMLQGWFFLQKPSYLGPIVLVLSPVPVAAFVLILFVFKKRGKQRALRGFVVTMPLIWVPLIAIVGWLAYMIDAHGFMTGF